MIAQNKSVFLKGMIFIAGLALTLPFRDSCYAQGNGLVGIEKIEKSTENTENTKIAENAGNLTSADLTEATESWRADIIDDQSFETELSEYDGTVWFAAYPAQDTNSAICKLIQNGNEILTLKDYRPRSRVGEFVSLDAVCFEDYNGDGTTDICLVETWEDGSGFLVYDGGNFDINRAISENATMVITEHTIENFNARFSTSEAETQEKAIAISAPLEFEFGSGAGAWGAVLYVNADGSFCGWFHKGSMGANDDQGNPCYESDNCEYSGYFTNIQQLTDASYVMELGDIHYTNEPGTDWYENGNHYVAVDAYQFRDAANFYLYLAGYDIDEMGEISEEIIDRYAKDVNGITVLKNDILYNENRDEIMAAYIVNPSINAG